MKHEDEHSHLEHNCLEAIENVYAYLDGELDPEDAKRFEHHLEHCRSCYTRREFENALSKRLQKSGNDPVPKTLQSRLRSLIDSF